MSDIDDTIRTLTEQVEGLQYDLETCREANSAWHDAMNGHDLDDVKNFLENHDISQVSEFLNNHDIDQVQEFVDNYDIGDIDRVLREYDLDDLKESADKIENYGEPVELAERVEELEAEVEKLQEDLQDKVVPDATDISGNEILGNDVVARVDYEVEVGMRQAAQGVAEQLADDLDSVKGELAYQCSVSQSYAESNLELENRLDRLEDYKTLYDSAWRELAMIKSAYQGLYDLYFSQVSGYDDVPSSAPEVTE